MKKGLDAVVTAVMAAILAALAYVYLFHVEVGVDYIRLVNLPR